MPDESFQSVDDELESVEKLQIETKPYLELPENTHIVF